jgi:hypothetical protein
VNPSDEKLTVGEPHDRLTHLTDDMLKKMEESEYHEGNEKVIILIQDGNRGGLVLHGYEEDGEAVMDLLTHLKVILKIHGKDLVVMPINQG